MKWMLICNDSYVVLNFRKELIEFLKSKNNEVYLLCNDNNHKDEIIDLGVKFFFVPFNNRSLNIFNLLKIKRVVSKLIKDINPNIVFSFQLKANIVTPLACKKNKIRNAFCMIEGLGDPFQPINFKWKIIRLVVIKLYIHSFKNTKKIFVLNNDDKEELLKYRIANNNQIKVISGIGIDTSKYIPSYNQTKQKRVVMFSRLLKNKGIMDFCEVARLVRKNRKDISFDLYGSEAQITKNDLMPYIEDSSINFHGYVTNVQEEIKNASIVASCSFREGFPRTILEAMALGKPVVATDAVGNKDAVINNVTGYLVPMRNIDKFSNKILEIIDNEELLTSLGKKAREVCVTKFDSNIINDILYKEIING